MQWVFGSMVHGSRSCHWAWVKGLHLVGTKAIALEPNCQVHHVRVGGARVRGNKIRNQILLFTCFTAVFVKHLLESIVRPHTRFHHFREYIGFGMFGGDFEITADMVGDQFFDIFGVFDRQIIAQA